jgi:hypothetical protein
MKTFILSFLFLVTFVVSCQHDGIDALESKVNPVDVYVAGIENNKACYWKNNQQTYLSSGDDITPNDIFLDNNNIYIIGYGQNDYFKEYFWKNNIRYSFRQYLNVPSNVYLRIADFTVVNNDIYFCGIIENPSPATPNEKYEYCYWKNGVKTILNTTADITFGYINNIISMSIYNSQVYTTGRKIINNVPYEGYYEGTTFHPIITIEDEYYDSIGNLTSNANNLYIAIRKNTVVYYRNLLTGVDTQPNQTIPSSLLPLIRLDGNDLYLLQYQSYFKNGNYYSINIDPQFELCYDMFILDQNIYSVRAVDSQNRGGKIYINNVETFYLPHAPQGTKQILKAIFAVQN